MKKISEIFIIQTVNRPYRGADGNLYYEERSFKMKYNPSVQSNLPRVMAKGIDLILVTMPLALLPLSSLTRLIVSVVVFLLYSSICEYKYGRTFGKRMWDLRVVNDHGDKPGFFIALLRNLLSPLNLLPSLSNIIKHHSFDRTKPIPYSMSFNNLICDTYVIEDSRTKEIRELQMTEGE